jgi:hypothetical protein
VTPTASQSPRLREVNAQALGETGHEVPEPLGPDRVDGLDEGHAGGVVEERDGTASMFPAWTIAVPLRASSA